MDYFDIPTVRIKHGDSYAIINESDFIEGEHELFGEGKKEVSSYSSLTKAQLIDLAREQGKQANSTMSKEALLALVEGD